MTPEELERMAVQAFADAEQTEEVEGGWWLASTPDLARFAALVRAQALEDAARVCEAIVAANEYAYADECAAAIRALGDTK